jgi:hypothetical protein
MKKKLNIFESYKNDIIIFFSFFIFYHVIYHSFLFSNKISYSTIADSIMFTVVVLIPWLVGLRTIKKNRKAIGFLSKRMFLSFFITSTISMLLYSTYCKGNLCSQAIVFPLLILIYTIIIYIFFILKMLYSEKNRFIMDDNK